MNSQDPKKLARSNRSSKKANRRAFRAPLSFERLEDRTVFAVNTVSFSLATQSVSENGTVTVSIERTGDTTDALIVPLTFSGTATKGLDYTTAITSSVTIAAGESDVTFSLPLSNDALVEGDETIVLTIGSSADFDLGTNDEQVVTIVDNDINLAPTFTKGPDQVVNGTSTPVVVNNWATNISPGSANETNQTLHFVVTARDPSLFLVQPAIDASGKLTFTPKAGFTGKVAIDVELKDDGGTAHGGSDTSTKQTFFVGTASAINNATPVNKVPKNVFIDAGGTATFNSGTSLEVSISDADAGNESVRITLVATQGTLTLKQTTGLTFINGDGTDDTTMALTGTVSAINAALNGLKFKANSGFTGVASISVLTNDLGNLGSGGEKSDSDTITVSVGASSMSGTVFLDPNGNNTQDSGEPGIPNVKVTIKGTGTDNSSFTRTTTTDASGNYSFTELPPGTYRVTVATVQNLKSFFNTSGGSTGTTVTIGTSVAPTPAKFVSKGVSSEVFGQFFFLASRGTPSEFFSRIAAGANSGSTLRAIAAPTSAAAHSVEAITSVSVNDVRLAAIAVWKTAGIDATQEAKLRATQIDITDLPGDVLGLAQDGKIWLDVTASGLGWFVDPTPDSNEEFTRNESGELVASGSEARAIDLLTVLVHEMGHILGLPDDAMANANGAMAEFLGVGTRRIPASAADRFFSRLVS